MEMINAIVFSEDKLQLIDQRKLPNKLEIFECKNYEEVEYAIRDMVVRGAPAIGATAAYGVYLASEEFKVLPIEDYLIQMNIACVVITKARPTAVNLMWAVNKMKQIINDNKDKSTEVISK